MIMGLNPCFIGQWATTIQCIRGFGIYQYSLNPCFIGQWATTKFIKNENGNVKIGVSILVLLDNGLRQVFCN